MPFDLDKTLKDRFGLDAFRPWQREAISALLEDEKRVLVVAPTGGGKSLCYQLPAVLVGGTSLIVSPLIALMEDQVQALEKRGIRATYLASTLEASERRDRERRIFRGEYELVYVAPERLASENFVDDLKRLAPRFVAIDEAHCISQWGHDFRPDYLKIGALLEKLSPEFVLACTATATPAVRTEILDRLGLDTKSARVIMRGFARPNLHLAAEAVDGAKDRSKKIRAILEKALGNPAEPKGGAIVYAGTRKLTEQLAGELMGLGYRVASYHAGLEPQKRNKVSELFAERRVDIVVATNAFGMGIDRADVRVVVHVTAPASIEGYYQEVGRAGRDGDEAYGLMLTSFGDFGLRRRLLERDRGDGEGTGLPRAELDRQWRMFLDVMRYVDAGSCRHDFVLRYFGDEQETLGGCGHCDVCERIEEGEESTTNDAEAKLVLQKTLAGIARAKSRAGLHAVADMLIGTDNAKMREIGFTSLSTYGILRGKTKDWTLSLLRRLIVAGLIDLTPGEYPMPLLTKNGWDVMRGEREAALVLPVERRERTAKKREKEAKNSTPPAGVDPAAFERLREARTAIAKEKRVPPYVVAHDRTLIEIAAAKPSSLGDLQMIYGMGPARIEAYGEKLLDAVRG